MEQHADALGKAPTRYQTIRRRTNRALYHTLALTAERLGALVPQGDARELVRRAIWPHKLEPRRQRPTSAKLSSLRNSHAGSRCFIVGTAPSINSLPLHKIKDDFVLFLNKSYLLTEKFSKFPDSIILSDPLAYLDYGGNINFDEYTYAFVSSNIPLNNGLNKNVYVYDYWAEPRIYEGFLQLDITKPLYHAHTVALFALQIAHYMGFKEIVLCGIDLDFQSSKPHFYSSSRRETKWAGEVSAPRAELMYHGFLHAAHVLRSRCPNIRIVNASPAGRLDCFERVDFDDLFAG